MPSTSFQFASTETASRHSSVYLQPASSPLAIQQKRNTPTLDIPTSAAIVIYIMLWFSNSAAKTSSL